MAGTLEHAFFYNSEGGDRVYDADSFEHWLKKFFKSGVFAGECQVTENEGMTVKMAPGYANADGKVRFFSNSELLQLETANPTYDRIDTIVIERNDANRDVIVKVVTGGYSSNPMAAAPIRENGIYQLVVAQIYVAAGVTRITQTSITDTRFNMGLCGIITGTVDEFDFDQFKVQFDSWEKEQRALFLAWFDAIKGQLSEDIATSLQVQVNELNELVNQNTAALGGYSLRVVDAKPATQEEGIIYLVRKAGS